MFLQSQAYHGVYKMIATARSNASSKVQRPTVPQPLPQLFSGTTPGRLNMVKVSFERCLGKCRQSPLW